MGFFGRGIGRDYGVLQYLRELSGMVLDYRKMVSFFFNLFGRASSMNRFSLWFLIREVAFPGSWLIRDPSNPSESLPEESEEADPPSQSTPALSHLHPRAPAPTH